VVIATIDTITATATATGIAIATATATATAIAIAGTRRTDQRVIAVTAP
jgi:hypothetical protein